MDDIAWTGRWTHPPVNSEVAVDGTLTVEAAEESDAWRVTNYGFVHDSEHALVEPLAVGQAMEVVVTADFDQQFDQAGIFVVASSETWVKAGLEHADGVLQVGAVVTLGMSDWSVAPVPEWAGRSVRVRVSRAADSLTVRAGLDGEALRLVRVAPFPGDVDAEAGPFTAAPSRAGLRVRFTSWQRDSADAALH